MIIAIDGPAASGKSTIAKMLANRLNYHYVGTGAMYRAITYKIIEAKIDVCSEQAASDFAKKIIVSFTDSKTAGEEHVLANNDDVTDKVYTPKVDSLVSYVSKIAAIRKMMVHQQRELAKKGNVVMEGRDVGTVVLPKADVKIFLTATAGERAKRRHSELKNKGHFCDEKFLKREIISRDRLDSTRKLSPLKKACDAFLVDTTGKNIDQVVEAVGKIIERVKSG